MLGLNEVSDTSQLTSVLVSHSQLTLEVSTSNDLYSQLSSHNDKFGL